MDNTKNLNRIKVVLAEKKHTDGWVATQLGKRPFTISKWYTHTAQPSLEYWVEKAGCLEVSSE